MYSEPSALSTQNIQKCCRDFIIFIPAWRKFRQLSSTNWSNEMHNSYFFVTALIFFSFCTEGISIRNIHQTTTVHHAGTSTFKRVDGPYHAFYDVDGTVCFASTVVELNPSGVLVSVFGKSQDDTLKSQRNSEISISFCRYMMERWHTARGGSLSHYRIQFNALAKPVR